MQFKSSKYIDFTGIFVFYYDKHKLLCNRQRKQNIQKIPTPNISLIYFVTVTLHLNREKKSFFTILHTRKITPPYEIIRNYRSVTSVLSIKYLWGACIETGTMYIVQRKCGVQRRRLQCICMHDRYINCFGNIRSI